MLSVNFVHVPLEHWEQNQMVIYIVRLILSKSIRKGGHVTLRHIYINILGVSRSSKKEITRQTY